MKNNDGTHHPILRKYFLTNIQQSMIEWNPYYSEITKNPYIWNSEIAVAVLLFSCYDVYHAANNKHHQVNLGVSTDW